jgi:Tfp pilus assembly protein FimV
MKASYLRAGALVISLHTGPVHAIGLGEILLHSTIGQRLRAEIPLSIATGETLDANCFSLSPVANSDLPVITRANLRLAGNNGRRRLLISGSEPITEPAFMISLRAKCGFDLQRDYVLIPEPPISSAESASLHKPIYSQLRQKRIAGNDYDEMQEVPATTSAISARTQPPLTDNETLTDDALVRIPKRHKTASKTQALNAAPESNIATPPASSKPGKENATNRTKDRLVIGDGQSAPLANDAGIAQRAHIAEMEERILKLETTLHTLHSEISQLDHALKQTTEARAAQNNLQLAKSLETSRIQADTAVPNRPESTSIKNWLELLLGTLGGGAVAATLTASLEKRHKQKRSM